MTDVATPVHVRIGSPLDHQKMISFLREMHRENGIVSMDDKTVEATLACGLARHHAIVGIVDGDNDEIAASVGLFVNRLWYAQSNHLEDRWVFVMPPYRRQPLARPLLEFAKRAAVALRLPLLIAVLSEESTLAKVRLYEREFSKMRGAVFLYQPENTVIV